LVVRCSLKTKQCRSCDTITNVLEFHLLSQFRKKQDLSHWFFFYIISNIFCEHHLSYIIPLILNGKKRQSDQNWQNFGNCLELSWFPTTKFSIKRTKRCWKNKFTFGTWHQDHGFCWPNLLPFFNICLYILFLSSVRTKEFIWFWSIGFPKICSCLLNYWKTSRCTSKSQRYCSTITMLSRPILPSKVLLLRVDIISFYSIQVDFRVSSKLFLRILQFRVFLVANVAQFLS